MPSSLSTGYTVSSNENNFSSAGINRAAEALSSQNGSSSTSFESKTPLDQQKAFAQSGYPSEIDQQQKIASLPSYPLLDTFSFLCILMIFPHWFSTITLILYVFLGNPEFLDSILSFVLKHKLNRTPNSSTKSSSFSLVGRLSLISFVLYLLLDAIFMLFIFYFFPAFVPYIILLSKSLIASNLTSLKNRYILDAFAACILLLTLENIILYTIKHFEIFRGDSMLSLTSTLSSTDFLYPLYYRPTASVTKTLLFHLTFHKIRENSLLMFQMEYALQFLHSSLSLYIIMHNFNPVLRKFSLINKAYTYIESFSLQEQTEQLEPISQPSDFAAPNIALPSNFSAYNNAQKPKFQNIFQIPKTISGSNLPTLDSDRIIVDDSSKKESSFSKDEDISDDDNSTDTDTNDGSEPSKNKIPMWFPEDHQVVNMNDVSSPSFVVAQNFENFRKMIWSSSAHLLTSSSVSEMGPSPGTSGSTFIPTPNSPNLSSTLASSSNSNSNSMKYKSSSFHLSHLVNSQPKRVVSKSKSFLPSEKKAKMSQLKYQQRLWLFLNAARTMFSRQDYYSGDYYSQNAVVTTGYGMDDYARNANSSSQCFIWFTGETTLAFELHNISLEQLLIKVNGIIWEHVSSCAFFGRELVIINGLSPLSQYDIDFVKITLNGELIHLTTTTVSTVFQNKTVTESNVSSPLATLQRSVVTTQEAIEREKARLKKMKTDWRKKSSQIKSEIENLNNRSNFSDESRNYKKLDSLRQIVAKSDIEVTSLSKKSEETRLLQTEIEEKYLDAKRLYETELRSFNKFENDNKNSIMALEKGIKSLLSEKNQLLVKKEKVISKKLRIHHEVELLTNELKSLKKTEIALRVERRKFRSIQRDEKYKLLINDIKKIERQLRGKTFNTF